MITNDNELNEIGDEIIFQSVPILGLVGISNFTDDLDGVTATRAIKKEFAFSLDGVVYTDWDALTLSNLQTAINPNLTAITEPVLRFKYTRVGTDKSQIITIKEVNIIGNYFQPTPKYPTGFNNMFRNMIYDNIDVYNLKVNLVEKMYDFGVVPAYFTRQEVDYDLYEDKDYIDFWTVLSRFFSLFTVFAFKFEVIYWRREYIAEFLRQKGLYFADADDIIEMQSLTSNFFDEIRQRGTPEIFKKAGFEYKFGERFGYPIPEDFYIQPSTPVIIDGVTYYFEEELPFGWSIMDGYLVAPDKNFHDIIFSGIDPQEVVEVGDYDNDYNDDFLIDLVRADDKITIPAGGASSVYKKNHGEYLRLICYDPKFDEFMYNQLNLKDFGWNVGNSSPCYRGLRIQRNKTILKGYEETADFIDLDNYPIL